MNDPDDPGRVIHCRLNNIAPILNGIAFMARPSRVAGELFDFLTEVISQPSNTRSVNL
jgi:hypothetical protein